MERASVMPVVQRTAVDIFSPEGLQRRLAHGKPLKIKFGADPSRPDLHLGHTVPLRVLQRLQAAGHEVIFVIGDYTAMIGDPSGKSKTRSPLTYAETRKNGETYFQQVTKILDPAKTRVVYNSAWFQAMSFGDALQLAGKYTLARILERDDFAKRYAGQLAIGIHELLYPLMQGYDSVALGADVEIGGTDQTFNLLVGRALQKDYGQIPQEVITFPLLPGLDGVEKMSKSLGNYIGIDEAPEVMYEKCMRVPDPLLAAYFRLTTDVAEAAYTDWIHQDIRHAHLAYAQAIVSMYHDGEAAQEAARRYRSIAAGDAPQSMACVSLPKGEIGLLDLLLHVAFASSRSDARRLIEGRGIRVNGETVGDIDLVIDHDIVLSRGKRRFVRVLFAK